MLERYIEIGREKPISHQRDDIVDMGVGVDIVQPYPWPDAIRPSQSPEFAGEVGHMRAHFAAVERARLMTDIDPIGRGVLADD